MTLQALVPFASNENKVCSIEQVFEYLNFNNTTKDIVNLILRFCLQILNSLDEGKQRYSLILKAVAGIMSVLNKNIGEDVCHCCLGYVRCFSTMIPKEGVKFKSMYYKCVSLVWAEFVRNILKSSYDDSVAVLTLSECIEIFYNLKKFATFSSLQMIDIQQMVISHSKFLQLMFSRNEKDYAKKGMVMYIIDLSLTLDSIGIFLRGS